MRYGVKLLLANPAPAPAPAPVPAPAPAPALIHLKEITKQSV